jgi:hypothetical protein
MLHGFNNNNLPVDYGLLIKLANFAHLDNQSDSEKKGIKSGVFLVHRRRREFFPATQELQSGQFGLRMAQTVHIKHILCVFAKLCIFYCSEYKAPAMQYELWLDAA